MIGRTLAGVAAALATIGGAGALGAAPQPTVPRESIAVPVTAAPLPVGCPGSLVLPVGEVGSGEGSIGSGSDDRRESIFTASADQPVAAGDGWSSESRLATEIERVGSGDVSGIASLSCLSPRNDTWLVGGSTALGSSARLVLTNPTAIASDVQVTVYGPGGQFDQPFHVAVGPLSQTTLLLEAVATGLPTLVTHVEATAAGVSAVIQDSRLDGFLPAGTDWVVPNPTLGTRVVVPGVGPSQPDGYDGSAVVRVFAPDGARISLSLVGATGQRPWGSAHSVTLRPGEVLDLEVPQTDVSSIVVTADAPVMAAAYSRRGRPPDEGLAGDVARDSVWVNGVDFSDGRPRSVVIPHYGASFVVYAASTETFRAVDQSGGIVAEQVIPAGTSRVVPLAIPSGTLVTVEGTMEWVVRINDLPGFVSAVQPVDISDDAREIEVAPGFYVP